MSNLSSSIEPELWICQECGTSYIRDVAHCGGAKCTGNVVHYQLADRVENREATWADAPVTLPAGVLLRAYGALSACAHHLRNLPATTEGDDVRLAALAEAAFDSITEATGV